MHILFILFLEPIAKLISPLKSPFCGHLSSLSLPNPPGVGFVEVNRASLLALLTGPKIIDFPGQSSFAIGSLDITVLALVT